VGDSRSLEGELDAQGASEMETMFTKALVAIASRLTKLEEDKNGSGEETPQEGM